VHITAMMLPSSLPLIRLFNRTAEAQPQATLVKAAFVLGYVAVWTVFGIFAFDGDILVHGMVERSLWLFLHQWVIAGSTLVVAGVFQFTDLKEKCLDECRNPAAYMLRHYRRGVSQAFSMGVGHAAFCLGCCWALMLLMFAVGVANLLWMAPLTAIMFVEKAHPLGARVVRPLGFALVVAGALVLANLVSLPGLSAAN
jgi:predicted metal-binding membrane protein